MDDHCQRASKVMIATDIHSFGVDAGGFGAEAGVTQAGVREPVGRMVATSSVPMPSRCCRGQRGGVGPRSWRSWRAARPRRECGTMEGDSLMVQAAWDCWGSECKLRWSEALYTLDERNRGTLGAFFLACSRRELDAFAVAAQPWTFYGYLQVT
jgi:hypothetical protein